MVVESERKEKACCFYVSEFHLEMILVPYINKKIEEKITILTEINLKETLEILISKMNLKEENKQKILELGWNGKNKVEENSNLIIIGSRQYITQKNKEIEKMNVISILDCYDFEEEKSNINDIVKEYSMTINTAGKNMF